MAAAVLCCGKASRKASSWSLGWGPRNFHGVACSELAFVEHGVHVWGGFRELQAAIDISGSTADGGCERFHGVAFGISLHERPISQGFIQLVDVFTLNVLNDREL